MRDYDGIVILIQSDFNQNFRWQFNNIMLKFTDPYIQTHVHTLLTRRETLTIFPTFSSKKMTRKRMNDRARTRRMTIAYESAYLCTLLRIFCWCVSNMCECAFVSQLCVIRSFIHSACHITDANPRTFRQNKKKIRKQTTKYVFVWQTFAWQRECCQCGWPNVRYRFGDGMR